MRKKNGNIRFTVSAVAVLLCFFRFAVAGQPYQTDANSKKSVEIHGFVSQGFIKSQKNNFLTKSSDGSFEFSETGFNLTSQLSENMSVGMQLVALNFGLQGSYEAQFDWYSLDYRWQNWLGLRVGRIKIPFGLYNERQDIDAARAPVLLPQSVYPFVNRDFLLAHNGFEIYGFLSLETLGSLKYHAYLGMINLDIDPIAGPVQIASIRVDYIGGGQLSWETPAENLKLSGSVLTGQLSTDLVTPTDSVTLELLAFYWIGSIEYTWDKFLFALEYSRQRLELGSSNFSLAPESNTTNERFYGMGTVEIADGFTPGIYYSVLFPNVDDYASAGNYSYDLAAFLRHDINQNWLVKLEFHQIRGTAGLDSSLNEGQPLSDLSENWNMFLVKTTGYF